LQSAKAADEGFHFFCDFGLVAQALHPGKINGQCKQGGLAVAQMLSFFTCQVERK